MRLMRDLELLRYAGGRLHVSCVSTAAGCDLIRRARAEGLEVTAATTCWHLIGTDADCAGFDGLYKVMPPLRTAADRDALRAAVLDGTLQAVVSDHRPADLEHHDTAFMESPFGIAGTEACFAAALHGLSEQAPRQQALEPWQRQAIVGPGVLEIRPEQAGDNNLKRTHLGSDQGNVMKVMKTSLGNGVFQCLAGHFCG
jgi:hypothetical protein